MANAPFKLRSQGSSFKMMGSSPMKHPLEREHTHPKKEVPPVKGPEDSDAMDIITRRKETGPQISPEDQQAEIDKLVEKREEMKRINYPLPPEKKKTRKRTRREQEKIYEQEDADKRRRREKEKTERLRKHLESVHPGSTQGIDNIKLEVPETIESKRKGPKDINDLMNEPG